MKKNVLFSIVVPVYNVETYLKDCIESILNQSYRIFELILVDDGSTDKSALLCEIYKEKDSRIKVIHKKNRGLVSARKAGISEATGDYAVCVDGDDWIDRRHLSELKKIIDKYSPDVICFNHFEVNENMQSLKSIPFRKGIYTRKDIEKEIYPRLIKTSTGVEFPPAIWSKAYKMELYKSEQIKINDSIKIGEDVACTVPCMANASKMYILDKALYYYRRNNTSMTKIKKPISWEGAKLIEIHLRNRLNKINFDFENQIMRRTVHALINVIKTQFYSQEKYCNIIKENIEKNLSNPIYANAIEKSKFKILTPIGICHFFIKNKIYFPFYVLSKVR